MTIVDLAALGTLTVFLALRVYRCRFRAPDNMYDFMKEGHASILEVFQAVTLCWLLRTQGICSCN